MYIKWTLKLLVPLTLKPSVLDAKSFVGYLMIAEDLKSKMDSFLLSLGLMETLLCLSIDIWVWGFSALGSMKVILRT